MYILAIFALICLIFTFICIAEQKHKNRNPSNQTEEQEELSLNLSREELYKTLNFMLMYGVIDFNQYNQIELKSLPYVSR